MRDKRTYAVAQLGARMHYAVPRILESAGRLEKFYTDISAVQGWPRLLQLLPNRVRAGAVNRLLARVPEGIPRQRITSFNSFGFEYAKRRHSIVRDGRFLVHLWAGKEFGRRVLKEGFRGAQGVFTFNSAGLEILQRARQNGLRTITEQTIAPMRLELELLEEESRRFPGWEASIVKAGATDYCDREEAEWGVADVILCGSEFVRDSIAAHHGPVEKCAVVPYGVDLPINNVDTEKEKPAPKPGPLRVLTIGTASLRKGSAYILESAKLLKGAAQFRLVGGIGVSHQAELQLREHVELTGPIARNEIEDQFSWADVFLLPSLCEGSATSTYEALAHGLPVICTPNTGSIVRDGMEGFIVPVRDAAAIADRIDKLRSDKKLRQEMSANATSRAAAYTVAAYGTRLLAALEP